MADGLTPEHAAASDRSAAPDLATPDAATSDAATSGRVLAPQRAPSGRAVFADAWGGVPWWLRVTVVYVLARVVSTVVLLRFAARQTANSFTPGQPHLLQFASIWDGAWYRVIAANGYPSTLPVDAAGHVTENAWAFMPAYPFLVRVLMQLTGTSFEFVAVTTSLLFGWGAALVFRALMRHFLEPSRAMFATVLFCVAPVSIMFQVAYAESMGLFLLVVALVLLVRRRFWTMLPVVLLLGMTRPAGLAFALLMGLFLVVWAVRPAALRFAEPLTVRRAVAPAAVAVVSGLVGLAWPAIAWSVTGVQRAYTDTELAWRSSYIGWKELVPFAPWVQGFDWWFKQPAGAVLLVLVVAGFGAFLFMPPARRIGLELRLWGLAYFVYLLAVFFPQSSTWRILLPIAPLLGIVALPRGRGRAGGALVVAYRVGLVVVCVALQVVWVYYCWFVNGYDWTPP